MKIHLHLPLFFHEPGQRENNEDCIYPSEKAIPEGKAGQLFLVCDGVGGREKGEIASNMVCEVFADYLKGKSHIREADIDQAIILAEDKIKNYIANDGDASGMATTMTFLTFHKEGATIAHVGDSRVYHFRGEQLLFRTNDHSFVSELVAKNIISEAEARNHPQRNIVTRAIMSGDEHQEADINHIDDVQDGDYFFLCTDGVLESLTDTELAVILGDDSLSNPEKLEQIKVQCKEYSKDNFSAYLLQVAQVEKNGIKRKINILSAATVGPFKMYSYLFIGILISLVLGLFILLSTGGGDAELELKQIESSMNIIDSLDINEIAPSSITVLLDSDSLDLLPYTDSLPAQEEEILKSQDSAEINENKKLKAPTSNTSKQKEAKIQDSLNSENNPDY